MYKVELTPYPETLPPDLVADSSYPRYRVEWIDRDEVGGLVDRELDDRRRVLWVSNRVSDCQVAFDSAHDDGDFGLSDTPAFCYHSRFKLCDRESKHQSLIGAFQDSALAGDGVRAAFGATTQVCEMSLDLDAEVLITELAPIASLIQRMGRCNRDSGRMRSRPVGRVYVLRPEPGREKPYEVGDLEAGRRFVDAIAGRDVSQDELERAYEQFDPSEAEPLKLCPFLDSGPYAEGRVESFRETDEFTVPCVLDYDILKVLSHLRAREPIDGFVVPVPRRFAAEPRPNDPRFPRWLSVALGSRYGALIGFDDRDRPSTGAQPHE